MTKIETENFSRITRSLNHSKHPGLSGNSISTPRNLGAYTLLAFSEPFKRIFALGGGTIRLKVPRYPLSEAKIS